MTFRNGGGLTKDVDVDLHVMDIESVNVIEIHVVLRTILPFNASDLSLLNLIEL